MHETHRLAAEQHELAARAHRTASERNEKGRILPATRTTSGPQWNMQIAPMSWRRKLMLSPERSRA